MPPHRNVIAGGRGMGPAVASRWAGAVAHNRVQAILASWAWWRSWQFRQHFTAGFPFPTGEQPVSSNFSIGH
jgi:hypothetical protein